MNRRLLHLKNNVVLRENECNVAMMTSSPQNLVFKNILVNTNQHAKFDVSMTLGLEVRLETLLPPV